MIFTLNEDMQTFNLQFEWDKYLPTELSVMKIGINVNEFCDDKNAKSFLGSLILEMHATALEQHLNYLKQKYKKSTILG